jgi:predicted DNA-binding transcriptional regulator YafY
MRSSRLLLILLHLQVHGRTTAATLARRLEVSERTIYRDMDALSAAGVPVVADRGVGGGWYLLDEYRTNLTGLNEDEIRTLFVANSLQLLGDLGLQRAAEDALTKLLAALPGRHQQSAELVRQRIHVDGTRWHATGEDLSWLSMLQEAIWAECKIELSYKRSDGETVTRQVDPWGWWPRAMSGILSPRSTPLTPRVGRSSTSPARQKPKPSPTSSVVVPALR